MTDGAKERVDGTIRAERNFCRGANRIRLYRRQQKAGRKNRRDSEYPAIPALTHGFLDIESRAATKLALIHFLVDLAKRGLDIGGGCTKKGDHPHPEDRTGSAETDRCGDARDVAGADAARQ